MTKQDKQKKVMSDIADILEDSGLTVAELVGILSILQTSYVLAKVGSAEGD